MPVISDFGLQIVDCGFGEWEGFLIADWRQIHDSLCTIHDTRQMQDPRSMMQDARYLIHDLCQNVGWVKRSEPISTIFFVGCVSLHPTYMIGRMQFVTTLLYSGFCL